MATVGAGVGDGGGQVPASQSAALEPWRPARAPFAWGDVEDDADDGGPVERPVSLAPPCFGLFLEAARPGRRRSLAGRSVLASRVPPPAAARAAVRCLGGSAFARAQSGGPGGIPEPDAGTRCLSRSWLAVPAGGGAAAV